MIPLNLRMLLVGISLPFHSLAAPNHSRGNGYVHSEQGTSHSSYRLAPLLPMRTSQASDLHGSSGSATLETYPTSTDGYDRATLIGTASGTGDASMPKSGLYPIYNSTSRYGSLETLGSAQQTTAYPIQSNQACPQGSTSTQTVTTVMTDTQTITTVVTSTQMITSTTTATITAYITATVTSTMNQASGGSGPTSGIAPISTGANGASYPNTGNRPNTAQGSVGQSIPGASIPYKTSGQPIYSPHGTGNAFGTPFPTGSVGQSIPGASIPYNTGGQPAYGQSGTGNAFGTPSPTGSVGQSIPRASIPYNTGGQPIYSLHGTGNAFGTPIPTGSPGQSSAAVPYNSNANLPTLLPVRPPYPINSGSSYVPAGSVVSPTPYPIAGTSGARNVPYPPVSSPAQTINPPYTNSSPQPTSTGIISYPNPTPNTASPAAITTTTPPPKTCTSPSTTTNTAFFDGLNTSLPLPTPYLSMNFTTFAPIGCAPFEYILSPNTSLPALHNIQLPHTPNPKTGATTLSFTLLSMLVSCSPQPANLSCTVDLWGLKAPARSASGSASGGLARMSIQVPPGAEKGKDGSNAGAGAGMGKQQYAAGSMNTTAYTAPPGGETGVGVPVNFTGAGWTGLQSVGFEAKIDGPWGETDGRTGVGVDGLAWEVVTCP